MIDKIKRHILDIKISLAVFKTAFRTYDAVNSQYSDIDKAFLFFETSDFSFVDGLASEDLILLEGKIGTFYVQADTYRNNRQHSENYAKNLKQASSDLLALIEELKIKPAMSNNDISEETSDLKLELSDKYDELVEMLNSHKMNVSNLVLRTLSEGEEFELFERANSIVVKVGEKKTPMGIYKHMILDKADGKTPQYYWSYVDAIYQILLDGTIFDKIDKTKTIDANAEIGQIEAEVRNLQTEDYRVEITKTLQQAKHLFDEAVSSKDNIDKVLVKIKNENAVALADLDSAKQGEIAYFLLKQFENKTANLKALADNHEGKIFKWVMMIFILAICLLIGYFGGQNIVDIKFNFSSLTAIFMILAVKLPLVFMVFFHLNEYSKAKKLYEEYENKRIMAATLVNSLHRIREELKIDTKELIEIIKTPMERIFDNPVHSIYGDKSSDKNSMKDMLEQFDKLSSIVDKIKKPN